MLILYSSIQREHKTAITPQREHKNAFKNVYHCDSSQACHFTAVPILQETRRCKKSLEPNVDGCLLLEAVLSQEDD